MSTSTVSVGSANKVEWSLSVGEVRRQEFKDRLSAAMKPWAVHNKTVLGCIIDGKVKVKVGKPEKALSSAFLSGPVVCCGLIQVDLVDHFRESQKYHGRQLTTWIENHKDTLPEFYTETSNGQERRVSTGQIALNIVVANDAQGGSYNATMYEHARAYLEYRKLTEEALAAIDMVVSQCKPFSEFRRARFAITGSGTMTPGEWWYRQTQTVEDLNRNAAKMR